jgi:7-carboxy-7-deazaguanine synthase
MGNSSAVEVCEIFRSIAGETTYAGLKGTFVRLSGCNLRCKWCDTQKAWQSGKKLSIDRVVETLLSTGDQIIVVTGGEPLIQPGSLEICRQMLAQTKTVLLETNGSIDISGVPEGTCVVLDMKPPSSNQSDLMDFDNLDRLSPGDQLKFVIAERADFDWAVALLTRKQIPKTVNILCSAASNILEPGQLADWVIASKLPIRVQVQLHKIFWPGGEDGISLYQV